MYTYDFNVYKLSGNHFNQALATSLYSHEIESFPLIWGIGKLNYKEKEILIRDFLNNSI